jgi:hypothetical protein
MRVHTGERPYQCDQCDSSFAESGTLVQHMRVHTGERPFPCDRCDRSFTTSSTLVKHMRVHTGERPYPCDYCDRSFTQLGSLVSHTRTHTAPFCASPDCAASYRVVVRNEKDICGICARGYTFGAKERTVFAALINHDPRFEHFVRDKQIGCGTRRRPDAYADIHISCQNMLFVIECDEYAHRGNSPECELTRLEEIQAAHGGALVRINPDAPDELSADNLERFAERCVQILETDHATATSAVFHDAAHIVHHPGRVMEYWGYKPARLERLRAAFLRIQSGAAVQYKR